jgi:DNA repair photolyase
MGDEALQQAMEPGTPTPRARLGLIRAVREAGLDCGVLVAPVMPWLTDGAEELDALFGDLAEAGASWAIVVPLHLRGPVRPLMFEWLAAHRPDLVGRYRRLYGRGANVPQEYDVWLRERVRVVRRRHGVPRVPVSDGGPGTPWRRAAPGVGGAPVAAGGGGLPPAVMPWAQATLF